MSAKQPRLTWGGRVILTVGHAAARYGMSEAATRQAIGRIRFAPTGNRPVRFDALPPIEPPPIDQRTPCWFQRDLDKAMRARPGTGANLKGHK